MEVKDHCPCGFEGENCDVLLESILSYEAAMNETCSEHGTCKVINGKAACICSCGASGVQCEVKMSSSMNNIIIMISFALVVLVVGLVFHTIKKRAKNSFASHGMTSLEFTQTVTENIQVQHIAAFRVSFLLVIVLWQLINYATQEALSHEGNHTWDIYMSIGSVFVFLYFIIGSHISISAWKDIPKETKLKLVEQFFLGIMHTVIPFSFILNLLIWVNKLAGLGDDSSYALANAALYTHLLQLIGLLLDVGLSEIPYDADHIGLVGVIPSVYMILDGVTQLIRDVKELPVCSSPFLSHSSSEYFIVWLIVFLLLHYVAFYGMRGVWVLKSLVFHRKSSIVPAERKSESGSTKK